MNQSTQNAAYGLEFGHTAFHLSISNSSPELVSMDGCMRIPLTSLDSKGLIKAKDLAHNQYVHAMIHGSEDLDVHRATLNYLCKAVEKAGNPIARPHAPKVNTAPNRKALVSGKMGRSSRKLESAGRSKLQSSRKSAA